MSGVARQEVQQYRGKSSVAYASNAVARHSVGHGLAKRSTGLVGDVRNVEVGEVGDGHLLCPATKHFRYHGRANRKRVTQQVGHRFFACFSACIKSASLAKILINTAVPMLLRNAVCTRFIGYFYIELCSDSKCAHGLVFHER
jgi:hypothetical protein